jgi:hypothetical protein
LYDFVKNAVCDRQCCATRAPAAIFETVSGGFPVFFLFLEERPVRNRLRRQPNFLPENQPLIELIFSGSTLETTKHWIGESAIDAVEDEERFPLSR